MKLATLKPRIATANLSPLQPSAKAHGYDRTRGSSTQRGYNYRWRKLRLIFLRKHPLCMECEKQGIVTAATDVDHKIPHRGDMVLFWDESNWAALCGPCHSRKTAKEDGGFGNPQNSPARG